MLLSILICSLTERKKQLDMLVRVLQYQIGKIGLVGKIEIIIDTDNGEKSIGEKRNDLLQAAVGKYVAFIDDDDIVSASYISSVIKAIHTDPDVVGIHLSMTTNGSNPEHSYHSIKFDHWYEEVDKRNPHKKTYYRTPNHLNPVRRGIALEIGFNDQNFGEDSDYSHRLFASGLLKTEYNIKEAIYYYQYKTNKE